MRTLSFTRKKALDVDNSAPDTMALEPTSNEELKASGALEPAAGHPLALAQSAAESSSECLQQLSAASVRPEDVTSLRARASPMTRLRRMMRSQSDESSLAAPDAQVGVVEPAVCLPTKHDAVPECETNRAEESAAQLEPETQRSDAFEGTGLDDSERSRETASAPPSRQDVSPVTTTNGSSSDPSTDAPSASAACDVFLNASIQLLHSQSDARQRIRQLWFAIQRLRYESQITDTGVELLHSDLLAIMKSFSMEKLDGARHLKAGYLTLVQAPDMARPPVVAKTLFGGIGASRPPGQRLWCTLSEEYGKLEMTPIRDESSSSGPSTGTNGSPLAGLGTKLKLPTSLSWLLTDALQTPASNSELARTIKLHGCQVRKIPATARAPLDLHSATDVHHQIQILVPNAARMRGADAVTALRSAPASHVSYSIYTFEVDDSDGGDDESESWVCALDRVCQFHLYMLEQSIRDAKSLRQYRDVLARHFPLCISLSWLRNRIDRYEPQHQHARDSSYQQQQMFQHQQQQRRSSKNLSMIQVIKDLERDQVLVDQTLIATASGGSEGDSVHSEHGTISEVVKYVVMRVMDFVKRAEQRARTERAASSASEGRRDSRAASSSSTSLTSSTAAALGLPTSPTNRFAKYTEARALAFVERVLRGSSRTQSGGDIYDAISFFCQHSRVSICPVSHDACPVEMTIVRDDACDVFQIEVQVRMRFKVVEMAPMATTSGGSATSLGSMAPFETAAAAGTSLSTGRAMRPLLSDNNNSTTPQALNVLEGPREWAVLEGALSRQFTLGKLSEPGTVTIDYIPSPER